MRKDVIEKVLGNVTNASVDLKHLGKNELLFQIEGLEVTLSALNKLAEFLEADADKMTVFGNGYTDDSEYGTSSRWTEIYVSGLDLQKLASKFVLPEKVKKLSKKK